LRTKSTHPLVGMLNNLVLATIGSTHAHAALLVHGVEAAVGVLVVVTGVPDVEGVPARHGVLHRIITVRTNAELPARSSLTRVASSPYSIKRPDAQSSSRKLTQVPSLSDSMVDDSTGCVSHVGDDIRSKQVDTESVTRYRSECMPPVSSNSDSAPRAAYKPYFQQPKSFSSPQPVTRQENTFENRTLLATYISAFRVAHQQYMAVSLLP